MLAISIRDSLYCPDGNRDWVDGRGKGGGIQGQAVTDGVIVQHRAWPRESGGEVQGQATGT